MSAAVDAKGAHIRRINDVLRDGAVQPSDFYAADSSTRLLLGRLLAYDAGLLAWLRGLGGGPAAGLPVPLDLEAAGSQLDRYLTTPSFG